jgi:hypothetical protein
MYKQTYITGALTDFDICIVRTWRESRGNELSIVENPRKSWKSQLILK